MYLRGFVVGLVFPLCESSVSFIQSRDMRWVNAFRNSCCWVLVCGLWMCRDVCLLGLGLRLGFGVREEERRAYPTSIRSSIFLHFCPIDDTRSLARFKEQNCS